MKFEKRQVYYVVITFAICYAIQAYWGAVSNILTTLHKAIFPFLMGAGIAYIINIVMSVYERLYIKLFKGSRLLMAIKRSVSMILSYATFIGLIVWLFSIVIPDLISSLSSLLVIDTGALAKLVNNLNENKQISEALNYMGTDKDLVSTLSGYSQQILKQVLSVLTNLLTSVSSIAATLLNVFVSFIFSIYVLANKEQLGRQFNLLIDTYLGSTGKTFHYVRHILHQRFHGFFVSQTLEAMILGSLTVIGMLIFQFPYALTVGVLVAFTALIPVVGAYIGVTIGFILIATESLTEAFLFVLFLILLQQFEGNVIYPKVVGGSIGLPSMWVLMAITIGGALWGILGMLLAVPVAATVYQIVKDHIIKRQTLRNRARTYR